MSVSNNSPSQPSLLSLDDVRRSVLTNDNMNSDIELRRNGQQEGHGIKKYSNVVTAFFGRIISFIWHHSDNKKVKADYYANVQDRLRNVRDGDLVSKLLKSHVDPSSGKPLEARIVQLIERNIAEIEKEELSDDVASVASFVGVPRALGFGPQEERSEFNEDGVTDATSEKESDVAVTQDHDIGSNNEGGVTDATLEGESEVAVQQPTLDDVKQYFDTAVSARIQNPRGEGIIFDYSGVERLSDKDFKALRSYVNSKGNPAPSPKKNFYERKEPATVTPEMRIWRDVTLSLQREEERRRG